MLFELVSVRTFFHPSWGLIMVVLVLFCAGLRLFEGVKVIEKKGEVVCGMCHEQGGE